MGIGPTGCAAPRPACRFVARHRVAWKAVRVSYDLALWVGEQPRSDAAAADEYERRMAYLEELDDDAELAPASPRVQAFLDELLREFPPLGTPDDEVSPWAVGPEPGDINGDVVCLNMTYPGAERAYDGIIEIARRHDLVCFDPQSEQLAK